MELTPSARALWDGVGRALVERMGMGDVEIAEALRDLVAVPVQSAEPAVSGLGVEVQAEIAGLKAKVAKMEKKLKVLEKIAEDLEGVSFDRAMKSMLGAAWRPKEILKSERPTPAGLGLSDEEWAAVLGEG